MFPEAVGIPTMLRRCRIFSKKAAPQDWEREMIRYLRIFIPCAKKVIRNCIISFSVRLKLSNLNLEAEYGDETSAFKCLAKGGGDVAFISLDTVKKNTGKIFQNRK